MAPIILIVLFFGIGIAVTASRWSQRTQPAVRRRVSITWALVVLGTIFVLSFTMTATGFFAWYIYEQLGDMLRESLGIHEALANTVAALAALPLAFFVWFSFSIREWKRNIGLVGIFAGLAVFSYARYSLDDALTFTVSGKTVAGWTILNSGRIKRCDRPKGVDRASGQPCLAMTPIVKQFLDDAGEAEPAVFIEKPTAFFSPNPGADLTPIIWHCERGDGKHHFARIPIRDPITGRQCVPVTEDMVKATIAEEGLKVASHSAVSASVSFKTDASAITNAQLPFREDFEDGQAGMLELEGGWAFDQLPAEVSCLEGRHCLCTKKHGTFTVPIRMQIPWANPGEPITLIVSFQIYGRDLRMTATLRDTLKLYSLVHNVIAGDDPPRSWASVFGSDGQRQKPVVLSPGWQSVVLVIVSSTSAEEFAERRWMTEEYDYVDVPDMAECSVTEWLYYGFVPFEEDKCKGRHKVVGYHKEIARTRNVEHVEPAYTVYQAQVTARLGANGDQGNVWITPEIAIYATTGRDTSTETTTVHSFKVNVVHPYDGTICIDNLRVEL